MATLIEVYNASKAQGELFARIQGALILQAAAILKEPVATARHAERLIKAKEILDDPAVLAARMHRTILASGGAVITDEEIKTAVAANFNDFLA